LCALTVVRRLSATFFSSVRRFMSRDTFSFPSRRSSDLHSLKKPFVVVRAMSDTAAHDANITFDEFIIAAGKQSAEILLAFLEKLAYIASKPKKEESTERYFLLFLLYL